MRFFKLKMLLWSLAQLSLDKTWHCFNLSLGEKFNRKNRITGEYQTMPQSPHSQLWCCCWCWCWCCCCYWRLCWCSGRWLRAEAENCFSGISKQQAVQQTGFSPQPAADSQPSIENQILWDLVTWNWIRWEMSDDISKGKILTQPQAMHTKPVLTLNQPAATWSIFSHSINTLFS